MCFLSFEFTFVPAIVYQSNVHRSIFVCCMSRSLYNLIKCCILHLSSFIIQVHSDLIKRQSNYIIKLLTVNDRIGCLSPFKYVHFIRKHPF